jgi:hypothetical protein
VISYGAKALSPAESRYSIAELECLALVQAVRENHTYIANNLSAKYEPITSHYDI